MRSSSKWLWVLPAVCVICLFYRFVDLALYPCTYIRNDVHAIISEQVDDLYLGTSHGKINIDPAVIQEVSGRTGHNMANGGEYPIDSYYLVRLMTEKGTKPKRVIYVNTGEYFTLQKEEGNNYLLFFHEFPLSRTKLEYFYDCVAECNIRTLLFPWYEYPLSTELGMVKTNLSQKLTRSYDTDILRSETQEYHENGYIERYPVDPSTFRFPTGKAFATEDIRGENLDWIRRLIRLCAEENIEFVSITPPMSEPVLEKYAESYAQAHAFFNEFYKEQGVKYVDFNSEEYYDLFTHKVNAFTDLDGHMHGNAARDFSRVLAHVLNDK